ncbi:MAG: hypothetical protein DCC88_12170 [Spirobacillus cienkowskii]|jgi:prophage tail gpP-like protein|uniref:Phage tail protein n=1 Tax=Spirobacillus cienkowskii TaxID=495820 RepID=A0A369KV92_9BACT|nr:MAG: hypothetical protein DCC88_12170 [Spirobacillus cienkowskii]
MIQLKANGKIFEGWLTASVTRSLAAVSGAFEIGYTDRWSGQGEKWQLKAGDLCELSYKGKPIICGYIDSVSSQYGSSERSLSVQGRDKTGDLVDSCNISEAKEFKGKSLKQLAELLAAPFGIAVHGKSAAAQASLPQISVQHNETVWESIDRYVKFQGVLAYPDAKGGLVLADVGSVVAATLREGENILSCSVEHNESEKFATYVVVGNTRNADEPHKTARGEVSDSSVKRPRLKSIVSHKAITEAEAKERAKWEMAQRVAQSLRVTVECVDWLNPSSQQIWEINTLVTIKAPACGLEGDFLIEETRFSCNENGLKTSLKLVLKDAYTQKTERDKQSVGEIGEV